MSVLKKYNEGTSQWEAVVVGKQGPSGTVAVTAPLTNSGTSTAAVLGVDYSAMHYGQNALINGAFEINQRSFTSTTSGGYGFDRWKNGHSGGTVTYSAQAFTTGTAPVIGYESANFARVVTSGQSASSDYSAFQQSIESVRTFAGQTMTYSFWAKAGSGTPKLAFEVIQDFGSGGSPSSAVFSYAGQVTLTASWARYSITFSVPSIAGKTIGTSGDNLAIILWASGGSNYNARTGSLGIQNNTFDFWGMQLEAGTQATPFKRAGGTIQGELAACQRYYYRFGGNEIYQRMGYGVFLNSTTANTVIHHPVTLRANPSSIEFSTMAVFDGGTVFTANSLGMVAVGRNSISIEAYISSGGNQYRPAQLITNNSLNGYLAVNAEL